VDDAIKNKAKKHAPRALNQAQIDIKNAENMMESNINDPSAYTPLVRKANRSAALLAAIVVEQKKVNYNLDESAAQKIVVQDGRLERLNFDLAITGAALAQSQNNQAMTADQLAKSQNEIDRKNQLLAMSENQSDEQKKQLRAAAQEKRFQTALESAQKQFKPSEADVYRQGDKILIRLKTIGFATGKSELPETSKALVDKVATVAQQLGPQQVVVEGHTDSVGSAEVNNQISQKRAETVMSYLTEDGISKDSLQAVGYGFQKPLSSNKTKAGRAQNRRVDIWITPDEMAATE
jgi:OmpA-OmpF porin, OOP family